MLVNRVRFVDKMTFGPMAASLSLEVAIRRVSGTIAHLDSISKKTSKYFRKQQQLVTDRIAMYNQVLFIHFLNTTCCDHIFLKLREFLFCLASYLMLNISL